MATFDEVVMAWKAENGGRIPVMSEDRKILLRDLVETLKSYDLLDALKLKTNQQRVVNACVNVGHNDQRKLSKWKAVVEADLGVIIHETFQEIKIVKAEPKVRNINSTVSDRFVEKLYADEDSKSKPVVPPKPVKYVNNEITDDDWAPVNTIPNEDFLRLVGLKDDE